MKKISELFKGFGKPQEPSIEKIVQEGLAAYEGIKELLSVDKELTTLLARAVVKFADHRPNELRSYSEEANIKYGRICVASTIVSVASKEEINLSMKELLLFLIEEPMELILMHL